MMAKTYLKPGDRVQALCELTLGEAGEWYEVDIVVGSTLRHFRDIQDHPFGGEWFLVRYDFDGSRKTNPKWGEPYFNDEEPGYW